VSTIQASSNNANVVFSETQSLLASGSSAIQATTPQFAAASLDSATLSANAGTTLATPIQTQVAGFGTASNGVPNVSVRVLNEQSSPTLSCAYLGGFADPGSVLSNLQGIASCYPVFGGSGAGTFYILIGGVSGTDISSALYLQSFGPYAFTSIPGTPAAVEIVSGNDQVGPVGLQLNPLVAKLVDANGNAVQGQTMVWSVVPAGAVAMANGSSVVTDNNGQVTATVSLEGTASYAGAAITVALRSNPNISATFQETLAGALTALNKASGDMQTARAGANFANPLVVQVLGSTGPVANYPVQYLVSGPVSLSSTTAGTNANGYASVNVTAGTTAGTATVTAVAGAFTQFFTLTITTTPTGPTPNGIAIVSGNDQSAQMGAEFQPLVVQVNSSSGPVSGYTVNFFTTGPVSISSAYAVTNSSGQASVNATAGNTSGAGSVTASITGYQASFSLTVMPPGPQITASSFLNAASRQVGALSPCGLAIISAPGLTPDGTADYTLPPITGRYPKTVHGLSVTFGGIAAPIVSVAMGANYPEVTLQVPCEVTPASSVPVVVTVQWRRQLNCERPDQCGESEHLPASHVRRDQSRRRRAVGRELCRYRRHRCLRSHQPGSSQRGGPLLRDRSGRDESGFGYRYAGGSELLRLQRAE